MTCLPPPGTASGTPHVLAHRDWTNDAMVVVLVWNQEPFCGAMVWFAPDGQQYSPSELSRDGFRYVGPFTPPEEVERLRAALQKAADQFGFYARSHAAKMPPDLTKAATNAEFAVMCRAALEPPHE